MRYLRRSRLLFIDSVESNEELLTEILVRLPPKAIFKFRCISRRWNGIILDPYFLETYSRKTTSREIYNDTGGVGRLWAFVQLICDEDFKLLTVVPREIKKFPSKFGKVDVHKLTFLGYYDGLIIFGTRSVSSHTGPYYVVNPLNKTWIGLPPSNSGSLFNLGLVCEDNKEKLIPSFRVVGIARKSFDMDPGNMLIETYSSRTGRWNTSTLVCNESFYWYQIHNTYVVSNGVFHWHNELSGETYLAVYDSNVDDNYVQLIMLPTYVNEILKLTRSPADEALWFGHGDNDTIRFWMLPKDDSESYKHKTAITNNKWILVHTIYKHTLCKDMAPITKRKKSESIIATEISSIELQTLIPGNPPVAVLSMQDKIFLLDLKTMLTTLVEYHGRPLTDSVVWFPQRWFPLLEPVFLSTYAPLANSYK